MASSSTPPNPLSADLAWPLWTEDADEQQPLEGAFDLDQPDGTPSTAIVRAVSRPWLFGYKPLSTSPSPSPSSTSQKPPNGRAVLILGGGGYTQLMVGREGIAVAHWLTSLGFTAFVLVHRFPRADTGGPSAPLDDARQALRRIAAHPELASEDSKIGVCGLSSGGHLAAALLAEYPAAWAATSSVPSIPRLAFAIIGYGPISTNAKGRAIVKDKAPLEPREKQELYDTVIPDGQLVRSPPPTFVVYSASDPVVPVVNAYRLAEGLGRAGGSVELHVFAEAPHGFALDSDEGLPVSRWPGMCEAWMGQLGLLK